MVNLSTEEIFPEGNSTKSVRTQEILSHEEIICSISGVLFVDSFQLHMLTPDMEQRHKKLG
jgi:hypothetical protein